MTASRPRTFFAATVSLLAIATALCFSTNGIEPMPQESTNGVQVAAPVGPATTAAASHRATAMPRGCWLAPIGSRFRFAVEDRIAVSLASRDRGTQSGGTLHTQCEVVTTVLDRRDRETLVGHRLQGLRLLGADGRPIEGDALQIAFTAAAATPVFVRLDDHGRVLGVAVADELDGDQRNFLRGTLGLLAAESPVTPVTPATTTWTSEGQDTTGTFLARHDVLRGNDDELVVRTTRDRYTRIVGQAELPQHELRGAAVARFDLAQGWLVANDVAEQMVMALPLLDLEATTDRRASVSLLAADTTAIDDDLAAAWGRANRAGATDGERTGGYAAGNERRLWRERLQGVTLEQLLGDVQRLLAAEPADHEAIDGAFQKLQWMLRLDDGTVPVLAQLVATKQVGEGVARVALGSLGAAGTTAAQDALVALRTDAAIGPALREAATVSCLQLETPNANLLDSLSASTAVGNDDAERGTSLLVLGALAPRAKSPLADGRTPLEALLAMEGEAAQRGELDTWLLAVANARAPQTLTIALRLFEHASAAVRGACCVAIRSLPAAAALEALLQRGLTDGEAQVRHEALLALSRRSEPAARAAIEDRAARDPDLGVRERATRLLQGS